MLFTKSIFKPKSLEDGLRMSVMSRHTLNDGKTIDARLVLGETYDVHNTLLAPPSELVRAYYAKKIEKKITFEEYALKYLAHLSNPNIMGFVKALADEAMTSDITLLCVEEDATYCHRKILAEECQKYQPTLQVLHR